ncbi:hypothetical protein HAL07_13350 [Helicobacter ailurogastricus]|uniref:Uncharacterized protein n=1 Tax=Helicobacter ailurogastricus TaxID=1578720 RepID=A0A0K2Y6W2_9HELI|nr:hypothetical protein HAL07_13350 [Helicobacter ailurogastricus]
MRIRLSSRVKAPLRPLGVDAALLRYITKSLNPFDFYNIRD